jgi:16S rRNA (cytosine1402-N4)-methyltransferase
LLAEVIAALGGATAAPSAALFVDGTVGGGGHAAALLAAHPAARLIAVDRDPEALAAARARLGPLAGRARFVHASYAELPAILADAGPVHGLLLDLGVSSHQLDRPERGFSFAKAGPLDMRMDPTQGPTARELIEGVREPELAAILEELGEERYSRKVARAIGEAARAGGLATTTDLAAVVTRAIPSAAQRTSKIHPATRTFQALRIAVNRELDQLAAFLAAFPGWMAPGGRCAVISFHSLEDRLVKQRFRDLAWTSSLPPRLAREAGEREAPVCTLVARRAITASDAELARNPRARSARLRVCERTAAPDEPARRLPR